MLSGVMPKQKDKKPKPTNFFSKGYYISNRPEQKSIRVNLYSKFTHDELESIWAY